MSAFVIFAAIPILYGVGFYLAIGIREGVLDKHVSRCADCSERAYGPYRCAEFNDKEFNYGVLIAVWPLAVIGIAMWYMGGRAYRLVRGRRPDLAKIKRLERELGIGE